MFKKALLYILLFSVWTSKCEEEKFDPKAFEYCKLDNPICHPGTNNPNMGEHVACRCALETDRNEVFAGDEKEMDKYRNLMLDVHNELRNRIASGNDTRFDGKYAADMLEFNWDEEMEYYARCRAKGSLFNKNYEGSSKYI